MKCLVSLYFDENTNKRIRQCMEEVAETTGNEYMLTNKVPPHITVSSFEVEDDEDVLNLLEQRITEVLESVCAGEVQWVGCGAFMDSVLYLSPVLNEYLQELITGIYEAVNGCPNVAVSNFYRPYQWLPHTTIGKKMTGEELVKGFEAVQGTFRILQGKVIKVGLAKASPYEEKKAWKLN